MPRQITFDRQSPYRLGLLLTLAPALILIVSLFWIPVTQFMLLSVDNSALHGALPDTLAAIQAWDGIEVPPASTREVLARELAALEDTPELVALARRLNQELPGYRSLILTTAAGLGSIASIPAHERLIKADARWGDPSYWRLLSQEDGRFTSSYLLQALDLRKQPEGGIQRVPAQDRLFLDLLGRTLAIGTTVTLLCLALGFPFAATMAGASPRVARLLLFCVLVPFWTSLLVRAMAWLLTLQREGLVNQTLIRSGLLDLPLTLVFNRVGLLIGMVHVLLPFMVLPLYSVLVGIPSELLRAGTSLGAGPIRVFWRIYLPLAMPGGAAGCGLVFVLTTGYYVLPAMLGGPGDQMIGSFIAYFTTTSLNWGMAAALALTLILLVLTVYLLLTRVRGVRWPFAH